jgi:hypothetical protein
MATDAASLITQASPYAGYASSEYSLRLMRLALIKQWALAVDPTIDTSPEALLAYAKCHLCFSSGSPPNVYVLELFLLVLFDQALTAIGGGGQDQGRITEEEVFRDTEEGTRRYTEEL